MENVLLVTVVVNMVGVVLLQNTVMLVVKLTLEDVILLSLLKKVDVVRNMEVVHPVTVVVHMVGVVKALLTVIPVANLNLDIVMVFKLLLLRKIPLRK